MSTESSPYRILCLDGGGAKGFYTLGVLREIEGMLGCALHERFDLIYGTSTGSIIAALLALGKSVSEIHALYESHVPTVMRNRTRWGKSTALGKLADTVFGKEKFEAALTGIGVVATNWLLERPMIFKNQASRAHGSKGTFVPGFGCTISDAVQASCSAYPLFERKTVQTSVLGAVELVDGGYCANNPTLYAIADAVMALERYPTNLRVLSIGVGVYPKPNQTFLRKIKGDWIPKYTANIDVELLQKTMEINTQSMEQLRSVLYGAIQTVG
jgi:patatin-like phospholipase/acyl hydrolase